MATKKKKRSTRPNAGHKNLRPPIKKGEVRNPRGNIATLNPPYKKGEQGPGAVPGNPAFTLDLNTVKRLTVLQLQEIITFVMLNDTTAIRALKEDPKSTILQAWLAAAAIKGVKDGNAHSLNIMFDRMVGKVKEVMEFSGLTPTQGMSRILSMTPEEREAEIKRLERIEKLAGND
jgi:hypothetical protein